MLTALAESTLNGQIDTYAGRIGRALADRHEALVVVADCEQRAVVAAWELGRCLVEKKRRLPHGHFTDWCLAFSARTRVSGRSASDYMRLATHFRSAANLRSSIRESLRSIPSKPSVPRREPTPLERAIEAPEPAEPQPVVHESAPSADESRSAHIVPLHPVPVGDSVTHPAVKPEPHVVLKDVELYTLATIIEAARAVMGSIDLDPVSCAQTQETVPAARNFTVQDHSLEQEWSGMVWMNLTYASGLVDKFVDKLLASSEVTQAIVLASNATETLWGTALLQASAAVCFPTGRVHVSRGDGSSTGAPVQGQMLVGMGPELDRNAFIERFGMFGPAFIRLQGKT